MKKYKRKEINPLQQTNKKEKKWTPPQKKVIKN